MISSKTVPFLKPKPSLGPRSLYDRFQGYLPGFVPRDSITRNTLGMRHTTPIAVSVRKKKKNRQQISSLCAKPRATPMHSLCVRNHNTVQLHRKPEILRLFKRIMGVGGL